MRVPGAVAALVEQWREAGSPEQQSFAWSLAAWQERFPQFKADLAKLPDRVDRAIVTDSCKNAAKSVIEAEKAFVVAMTWGYGKRGYGPHRTARIFSENDDAGKKLRQVAFTVEASGSVEGYRLLANECRLKYLGPAFGTKFLAFCPQAKISPPALVIDANVGKWLLAHTDLNVAFTFWRTPSYDLYVTTMSLWAADLQVEPQMLEQCIFAAATGIPAL